MHTARRVRDFRDSGIQTCGTTLGSRRILKFAREPLTLAPAAGRRNEDPIGEKHRRQQRAEPLQQLPTCTHIAFFGILRRYFVAGDRMLLAMPSANKPRSTP